MSLRNRVALVTGGSRGIGRGLALRLEQDGARMAIAYRSNKVAAQQTLRQLQANGADCVAVETDVTDAGRCAQLIKTVVDRFGRLDVIVNNVGDFRWGTLAESSLEDWQSIFTSNLLTVLYMCRAALPHMRKARWGRIINMGAVGAERAFGQAKVSAYAAAKAAVVALSRSLALEEAKKGITVAVATWRTVAGRDNVRVCVLCGKGNNGGDGFVAARYLKERGVATRVFLFGKQEEVLGDAATNLARWRDGGNKVEPIVGEGDWERALTEVGSATIIVDALLGTGLRGAASGIIARAISDINRLWRNATLPRPPLILC